MSKRFVRQPVEYVHTCPICELPLIKVGFCHLLCPGGHYQEVCSDLFMPTPIATTPAVEVDSLVGDAADMKTNHTANN